MRWSRRLSFCAAVSLMVAGVVLVPGVRGASPSVEITDTAIKPADVTIVAGDVVTWKNTSAALHAIVADDGSFDSGPLSLNDQFANLFEVPGTYTYRDPNHPGLAGVVHVTVAPPTATPNGTAPPTPPGGTLPPDFNTPVPVPTPSGAATLLVPSAEATDSASLVPSPGVAEPGVEASSGGSAAVAIIAVLAITVVIAFAFSRRRR